MEIIINFEAKEVAEIAALLRERKIVRWDTSSRSIEDFTNIILATRSKNPNSSKESFK